MVGIVLYMMSIVFKYIQNRGVLCYHNYDNYYDHNLSFKL